MINRVVLTGRLTKDPEMKYTQSGIAVVRFTLAVNRTFTNQQGEREADFVNCVAWRKQAENVTNYLNKGSLVGVDGRIQTSSFEGQDGKRVFMTEVVADGVQFLETQNNKLKTIHNHTNKVRSPFNQIQHRCKEHNNINIQNQVIGSRNNLNTINRIIFRGMVHRMHQLK